MNAIKKIYSSVSKMPWNKRVQIALAFILTITLLVSAPSFAWFSYKRRIVKLQKVEAPNVLVLSAAHDTSVYSVSQVISGSSGSGGIAGYYNTFSTATFPEGYNRYADPTSKVSISNTCYVDGNGNCGAYYGELQNDGTMSFSALVIAVTHNSGSAASFGGLFGKYSAASLANSLTISTTGTVSPTRTLSAGVTDYGGLIGKISGAAYVNINGATTRLQMIIILPVSGISIRKPTVLIRYRT